MAAARDGEREAKKRDAERRREAKAEKGLKGQKRDAAAAKPAVKKATKTKRAAE